MKAIIFIVLLSCSSPEAIHLRIPGTPVLVAYRADSGETWKQPTGAPDGALTRYDVMANNTVEIIVVCVRGSGSYYTQELMTSVADWGSISKFWPSPAPCPPGPVGPTAVVSGQMAQAGAVYLGYTGDSSSMSPWTYQLTVPEGKADIVATDGTVLGIRRDQQIVGDTNELPIDLSTDVEALQAMTLSVSDVESDDSISSFSYLYTDNSTLACLSEGATVTVDVAPGSLLKPGDEQIVDIVTMSTGSVFPIFGRGIHGVFSGQPLASYELMPRVESPMYGASSVSASWASLPGDYTMASISYADGVNTQWIAASRDWISQFGNSITFDSPPEFDSIWSVSLTAPAHAFGASRVILEPDVVIYSSDVVDQIPLALTPPMPSSMRSEGMIGPP